MEITNWKIKRALMMPKKRLFKKLMGKKEIYAIALRKRNGDWLIFDNKKKAFRPYICDGNFWYADPILYNDYGDDYIFAEKYNLETKKGCIVVSKIEEIDKLNFIEIISESYHMSFPEVFKLDNKLYMVPETSENNSINVYECISFPYEWKKIFEFKTNLKIVDSALVRIEKECAYFLASEISDKNPLKSRFVEYKIVFGNQIKLEIVRKNEVYSLTQRNGGGVIKRNNSRYYVIQNSTELDYGVSLTISNNKDIYNITCNDIKLSNISNKEVIGIHTYSVTDNYEAIDIRYI